MKPDNKTKFEKFDEIFSFFLKLILIAFGGAVIGFVIPLFTNMGRASLEGYIYPWIFAFGSMVLSVAVFMFYHLVKQKEKDNGNAN